AVLVIPRNPHHVAMVFGHEIGVFIDERLPHPGRMFGIYAEDDGLLKAIATLLQEAGYLLRSQLGTIVQHQRAVEVLGVVDPVLDLLTVTVELTLLGPIAL